MAAQKDGTVHRAMHLRGRILPSEEERDVYVVDGRFTFDRPARYETVAKDAWLLPGLVDAHVHLAMNSPAGQGSTAHRVRASARAHLEAGVLLLREPGGPDRASAELRVEEGLPRVLSAGRFLAPPGGYFPGLAREVEPDRLADAVDQEASASRAWVKLVGDFVGPDGRLRVNWTKEQIRIAVRAAHRHGARLTIHAIHPDTCTASIEAGVDGIEHGSGISEEHIEPLRKHGVAWCPTLIITPLIPSALGGLMSSQGRGELGPWLSRLPGSVKRAAEAGVTLLAGTDAAMTPHGVVAEEVARFLQAGVTPGMSLAAASWAARQYLGYPGIEEGAPADLTAFKRDPRGDASVLRSPMSTILNGVPVQASGNRRPSPTVRRH